MNASLIVAVALLSTTAAAASPRVAMLPLSNGDGVKEQTAESFSDALAAELRKLGGLQLITQREVSAVLSVEQQKQLMGCESSQCMTELAGALDVDELVTGTLSKLGESWMLQVQRVDAKKGSTVAHASRRKKGGGIDDLIDELPSVAKQLFSNVPERAPEPPKQAQVTQPPPPAPLDPPYQDVPAVNEVDKKKLTLVTDGKGHYVAVVPFEQTKGEHLLSGTATALYQQRPYGGGSSGRESFDVVFWDPRAKAPWQAGFEFRDNKYKLQCGDSAIDLKVVPPAQAKKLLARAKIHGVRWQRYAYALARDDDGNWFYVDRARTPEDSTDFRIYLGTQGELRAYKADVLAHDQSGDVFRAAGGKLKLNLREKKGEWVSGEVKTALTVLPVEDNARQIYSTLGAYKGMPLGTPCDPFFQ